MRIPFLFEQLECKELQAHENIRFIARKRKWEELIAHQDDVFLSGIEIFKKFLVLQERKEGLIQMRVMNWSNMREHYISFSDPTYSVYANVNLEFDTDLFRFSYTSLTTPNSTYDYNLMSKERTLLKQQEVLVH